MRDQSTNAKKSVAVQGALLKELRERCGWTQEELAERTALSDRSVRNAEAGKPIHLRSIKSICDILSRELKLELCPVQLFQSPHIGPLSGNDPSKVLEGLIQSMFREGENFSLEDLIVENVVYSCELGTLLGIAEVQQRLSALRTSCQNHEVSILGLSVSGEYAAASWSVRNHSATTAAPETKMRYGCTCIRTYEGLIVEAWDFPACNSQSDSIAKFPPVAHLNQSVKVNGDLVRTQRIAQALTQDALAVRTGLSVRLIRSAENGNSISQRSCRRIAEALSVPPSTIVAPLEHAGLQSLMARRAQEYLEEIWNQENYSVIDTHLTPKFRFHHEAGVVSDRSEMKKRIVQFRRSFGEFDFKVTSSLDFGAFVVCRWHVKMRHIGKWQGLAPTGKRVAVNGASWVHVVGEQFGDAWDFWNPALVLARLRKL